MEMINTKVVEEQEDSKGQMNCFAVADLGAPMTMIGEDLGLFGFECVSILIDPDVFESVLTKSECVDIFINEIENLDENVSTSWLEDTTS